MCNLPGWPLKISTIVAHFCEYAESMFTFKSGPLDSFLCHMLSPGWLEIHSFYHQRWMYFEGRIFLVVSLEYPILLVKLLHRFLCGSTVWQIPENSLLKTSVEWSNGFIADSWVFISFPLRYFFIIIIKVDI